MDISEFINQLGSSDLRSLINVLAAYQEARIQNIEHVEYFGYDNDSGFVYCVLEENITIYSAFGNKTFYSLTDDEEKEFNTLEELLQYLKK